MLSINEKIVKVANSYIGQKEVPGNAGFRDPVFEAKMKAMGWKKGESWCAYLCELIWKEAYTKESDLWQILDKLFSPSAVATMGNFKMSKLFKTGKEPIPGSVVIFQQGFGWQGHAGIVIKTGRIFQTVEGNTNATGGREGIIVASKNRALDYSKSSKKLNLVGFIHPAVSDIKL